MGERLDRPSRRELTRAAPVVSVLPEFGTPDPAATRAITIRQLLSHTGGMTCDFTYDSGRGDDCLAKYVQAARDVALDCPPGTAFDGAPHLTWAFSHGGKAQSRLQDHVGPMCGQRAVDTSA